MVDDAYYANIVAGYDANGDGVITRCELFEMLIVE